MQAGQSAHRARWPAAVVPFHSQGSCRSEKLGHLMAVQLARSGTASATRSGYRRILSLKVVLSGFRFGSKCGPELIEFALERLDSFLGKARRAHRVRVGPPALSDGCSAQAGSAQPGPAARPMGRGSAACIRRLEALQHGREGPRVEVEPPTDVLDGRAVLLPQDQHRQVLGIGQAKRLEDRPVAPAERVRSRVDREAELSDRPHTSQSKPVCLWARK